MYHIDLQDAPSSPLLRGSDCFLKLKTLNSRFKSVDLSSRHDDLCFAVWMSEMLGSMYPKLNYEVACCRRFPDCRDLTRLFGLACVGAASITS